MAAPQPNRVADGAGDPDEETPVTAKSAEDRKAAAALSSLDAPREDESAITKDVDREAVRKAMDRITGSAAANGNASKGDDEKKAVKKVVKVDPSDVALLIEELELSKLKATDLLKAHDGDAEKALRAFINPVA